MGDRPRRSGPGRLPRLRQESLAEKAFDELKTAILSGRLASGAALAEVELAEALGISRTPVREALARLRTAGLVEAIPGGGNVVRTLSHDEVRELFLLREALECVAAREWVGGPRSPDDLDELERLIDQQRRAQKSGDVERFLDADERFHLAIARQAGLTQTTALLASLRERMRQAGLRAVTQPDRLPRVLDEHTAVLRALQAHDADRATRALLRHLDASRMIHDGARK